MNAVDLRSSGVLVPTGITGVGYKVQFLEPEQILERFDDFRKKCTQKLTVSEAYIAFAEQELQIEAYSYKGIKALTDGDPIDPKLANAVLRFIPGCKFKFVIDRSCDVRFPDVSAIQAAFNDFKANNPHAYQGDGFYGGFVAVELKSKKGPQAIAKVLKCEFVSPQFAEEVLAKFTDVRFELKIVRHGPKKTSAEVDMLKNGVRYAIVPMGSLDDFMVKRINHRLQEAGFSVGAVEWISHRDVKSVKQKDFHFVVNVFPNAIISKQFKIVHHLYDVRAMMCVKTNQWDFNGTENDPKIIVIDGSPEHELCKFLKIQDVYGFTCDNPRSEILTLLDFVANNVHAGIINHYSLISGMALEAEKTDEMSRVSPIEHKAVHDLPNWLKKPELISFDDRSLLDRVWMIPISIVTPYQTFEREEVFHHLVEDAQLDLRYHIAKQSPGAFDSSGQKINKQRVSILYDFNACCLIRPDELKGRSTKSLLTFRPQNLTSGTWRRLP